MPILDIHDVVIGWGLNLVLSLQDFDQTSIGRSPCRIPYLFMPEQTCQYFVCMTLCVWTPDHGSR